MSRESWFERGHVAIVTGASKGFGRATARLLAQRGLRLVIDARGAQALRDAQAELSGLTDVAAELGDVADSAHVHRLIQLATDRFGRIDLVVNNASTIGRSPMPALDQLSPAVFERVFTTNAYAPLHLIQHALPLLREARGTIVNVSSDAAVAAYPGWGGYGASKAALEHLSRVLAVELEGTGVTVIVADPGNMDTALHRDAEPGADLSGLRSAEDVAPALLDVIAGPRAPFVRVELQALRAGVAA
jgi:NAD(P)-dependent dehydrogenase (short-subunit alcohol dehydrogenase family)